MTISLRKLSYLILLNLILLVSYLPSLGCDTLIISNQNQTHIIHDNMDFFDCFPDALDTMTFEKIKKIKNIGELDKNKQKNLGKAANTSYWGVLTFLNYADNDKTFVLEFYDQNIDYIEIYIPDVNGEYKKFITGDAVAFEKKQVRHKNYVFQLPPIFHKEYKVYFKVKASSGFVLVMAVKNVLDFAGYAIGEYSFFGVLWGIVIAMIFYNLFLFFAIKDKTYLYYVLFVVSLGLYTMASTGTGFHFIWTGFPAFNNIATPLFQFLLVIFALLYSSSFLNLKVKEPFLYKTIQILILIRSIEFVLLLMNIPLFVSNILDALLILSAFSIGLVRYLKGFKSARYFLLGYCILFIGFIMHFMGPYKIANDVLFIITSVYSIQIASIIEMIFFSFALSDKIKNLTLERDRIKDLINQELEQKVKERTEELDTFVYRVSHDLKGPLKSITAMTNLALKDVMNWRDYIGEIKKSSMRLENMILDFLSISKVKQGVVNENNLNYHDLTNNILNSLKHSEYFKDTIVHTSINHHYEFIGDEALIASILQNLIENGIKYKNLNKSTTHEVTISIDVHHSDARIKISDTGRGIQKEVQKKVFEMFYRNNTDTKGTGLGLFIVKSTIEKMKGKIHLHSEEGKGTTIEIIIPNKRDSVKKINKNTAFDFSAAFS